MLADALRNRDTVFIGPERARLREKLNFIRGQMFRIHLGYSNYNESSRPFPFSDNGGFGSDISGRQTWSLSCVVSRCKVLSTPLVVRPMDGIDAIALAANPER